MSGPKVNKEPNPKIVIDPKSSPAKVAMMPDPARLQDMIRERAYELYEKRGREPGHDGEDWLRAERDTLNRER